LGHSLCSKRACVIKIAVLCATRRGLLFLEKLHALVPSAELLVFSFKEEPCEPPFLADIRQFCSKVNANFYETKHVDLWRWDDLDLMFCVSWRYMVSASVYSRPRLGSFVFHDSLLPIYRGFSPTVWAMINGETRTGVTLFEMTNEVDAGPIILQVPVAIMPDDYIDKVMEKVTQAYLHMLEMSLSGLLAGSQVRILNLGSINDKATYGCKRLPEDNRIDWNWPTRRIYNLIRAVSSPYPGAFTTFEEYKLIVWHARLIERPRQFVGRVPGRVIEIHPGEGVTVLTGDGSIMLTTVESQDRLGTLLDLVVMAKKVPANMVLNRLSCTLV